MDCSKVSLIGDMKDPEHVDQGQEQVSEIEVHSRIMTEWIKEGHIACYTPRMQGFVKTMWNPASVTWTSWRQ